MIIGRDCVKGCFAPIFAARGTARYAMKREVAACGPVFPLSMSDFKPGDKEYCPHKAVPVR